MKAGATELRPVLRLVAEQDGRRGKGRIELLEKIGELGSISAAAKALGLSYKAAWEAVEAMNNLSEAPLVERVAGGRHGGGTALTALGLQVLSMFRRLEGQYREFLAALRATGDFERFYQLMRRFEMKTSARNEFLGRVRAVKKGAVNAEVVLDIGSGAGLVAIITNESVDNLGLEVGVEAYALIKAPWVIVTAADCQLRTSARNKLCGVVTRCQEGAVNGEVVIELDGGKHVAAIITNESIQSLGLKEGVRACALIKASHIILAVTT
ncbi:TOBE domain-containing protein [Sulfuriferula plumbiphila]|uniref:TOBE domain-containing protein n=3 Tax=Sulfuriferula plumbiphila TaxID=171865 RepID=UPI00135D06F5|nr:TOBE domain-containing protein [Sulfuriferula plumbiphila]BBP04299.1 ModE family transcriptional regulator [Sulfuriferula plumbiphila]